MSIAYSQSTRMLDESQDLSTRCHPNMQRSHDTRRIMWDSATRMLIHTTSKQVLSNGRYIFAIHLDGNEMLVALHDDSMMVQHTCFFGDSSVAGVGELQIHNGNVTSMNNQSGHFTPTPAQSIYAVQFLIKNLHQLNFNMKLIDK